jgi:hypothetical protein
MKYFGGLYYLHLQGSDRSNILVATNKTTQNHDPDDCDQQRLILSEQKYHACFRILPLGTNSPINTLGMNSPINTATVIIASMFENILS